jgi:hypothetical protein
MPKAPIKSGGLNFSCALISNQFAYFWMDTDEYLENLIPSGQGPVTSRLVEVKENEGFIDESGHGDVVIRVEHRIQPIASFNLLLRTGCASSMPSR